MLRMINVLLFSLCAGFGTTCTSAFANRFYCAGCKTRAAPLRRLCLACAANADVRRSTCPISTWHAPGLELAVPASPQVDAPTLLSLETCATRDTPRGCWTLAVCRQPAIA